MGRTTAGWRAPPAPASPGAAAGRPAPAPARHSLGPAWRCLRPLAAARHCARPWWSSPLLVVRRARCPGTGGDLERCYPPVTYPGYLPGRSAQDVLRVELAGVTAGTRTMVGHPAANGGIGQSPWPVDRPISKEVGRPSTSLHQ